MPFARGAYVNGIVVASRTLEDHLAYLQQVLSLLAKHNIAIKVSKCFMRYPTAALPGRKVNAFGLSTTTGRLEAIAKLTFSRTVKQLETYLGMSGFLRSQIQEYATIAQPLQNAF